MLAVFILIVVVVLGITIFIKTAPQFGAKPSGDRLKEIELSKNYYDGQFQNLVGTKMDMDFGKILGVMREWMFNSRQREPQSDLPVRFGQGNSSNSDTSAYITWFGHSAVLLEMEGKRILIDPMLGPASSPVRFMSKRFEYEKPIDLASIGNIDAVILSHDHYDHLDYYTIKRIRDEVGHFFTPLGVGGHLVRWGVDRERITELDWGEDASLANIRLIAAPARHFSGRGTSDRNKTLWASWIIQGRFNNIYFSGDGGYGDHFKTIGDQYGPFDFVMVECGQYNENWHQIHMMPEESVQAAIDVRGKVMMPIHWGAFNLSLHVWTDPIVRSRKEADLRNVMIVSPFIGQRFEIRENAGEPWWVLESN